MLSEVLAGVILCIIALNVLIVVATGVANIISDYQHKRHEIELEKADKERLAYIKTLLEQQRERQREQASKDANVD